METLDLAIVGGGPAGMAAALVAGRARLRTAVVNDESPRNAVTTASHGFLTRDGAHPLELLVAAKEQLHPYSSVQYVACSVERITKDDGFVLHLEGGGRLGCERLVIATGYRDDVRRLELPGIEKVYGSSAYPCPFCDGYEHRDQRVAVLGAEGVEHFVPVVRMWSSDVAVFTHGRKLDPDASASLHKRGVPVEEARIVQIHSTDGALEAIELDDGTRVARDVAFIGDDYSIPSSSFAEELGVPSTQNAWGQEVPEADDAGRTAVERLYVVGDARSGFGGLMASAAEGSACAEQIVHEIATERWAGLAHEG